MLESVLFLASATLASGAAALVLWFLVAARRATAKAWRAAAGAAGLTGVEVFDRFPVGQVAAGRSGPLRVEIRSVIRPMDDNRLPSTDTRVIVEDVEGRLGGVSLQPEGSSGLGRLFGPRDIEVGDPGFDAAFFISGAPALALAFLDTPTRGMLYRMNDRGRFEVSGTAVTLDLITAGDTSLLVETIRSLLEVCERLRDRSTTAVRLASNALHDRWPAARLNNLLCLVREFGEHPVVPETLRAAGEDRDPEVRLRAAIARGEDGRETLLAMVSDFGLADAWQAAAVSALGRKLPVETTRETLDRALRSKRDETARACVEALRFAGEAGVPSLVEALAVDGGLVAATAARVLGALRAASAEEPLVRALACDAPGLRLAAAEALGRLGSTAAVLPLKQAAESHPEAAFRRAVRQAVAEIQARLPNASPGQLSLSAADAGQLSLADGEAGQLSLAEGVEGRLSLTPEGRRRKP